MKFSLRLQQCLDNSGGLQAELVLRMTENIDSRLTRRLPLESLK